MWFRRRGVWCASRRPPLGVRLFLSQSLSDSCCDLVVLLEVQAVHVGPRPALARRGARPHGCQGHAGLRRRRPSRYSRARGVPRGQGVVRDKLVKRVRKALEPLSGIMALRDTKTIHTAQQLAQVLLRFCSNTTLTFFLRTMPPSVTQDAAREHDRLMERGRSTPSWVARGSDATAHGGCALFSRPDFLSRWAVWAWVRRLRPGVRLLLADGGVHQGPGVLQRRVS